MNIVTGRVTHAPKEGKGDGLRRRGRPLLTGKTRNTKYVRLWSYQIPTVNNILLEIQRRYKYFSLRGASWAYISLSRLSSAWPVPRVSAGRSYSALEARPAPPVTHITLEAVEDNPIPAKGTRFQQDGAGSGPGYDQGMTQEPSAV
jgi:hypothetical protein